MNEDELRKQLKAVERELSQTEKDLLCQSMCVNQYPKETDSLVAPLEVKDQPVVLDNGVEVLPPNSRTAALAEIKAAEEKDRQRRIAYEKDRQFFEKEVSRKTRSLSEIQDDYIKLLHPYYREKFIAGIEKYGTIGAARKYMKDQHGLKLRSDVITRIAAMIPSFKVEMDDAIEEYRAMLHMEVQRRAVEGIDKNIYDRDGEVKYTEKVYSDALLSKMVDTYSPDYKEAKQKDNKYGNQIQVQIIKDFHNYNKG